ALQALQMMRVARAEIAMVVGERGRAIGMVRTHDLVKGILSPEMVEERNAGQRSGTGKSSAARDPRRNGWGRS
ncbi:MAG: hypothetical protein AAF191_07475, partial [Verrucomicrobiota bacterium]